MSVHADQTDLSSMTLTFVGLLMPLCSRELLRAAPPEGFPIPIDLEGAAAAFWVGRPEREKLLAIVRTGRARAFELFERSSSGSLRPAVGTGA